MFFLLALAGQIGWPSPSLPFLPTFWPQREGKHEGRPGPANNPRESALPPPHAIFPQTLMEVRQQC